VARAYGGEAHPFGPKSLDPSPFDPRLILRIAPAVAQARWSRALRRRPLENLQAYADSLIRFVFRSGFIMKPLFNRAKAEPKRVIYAEGEDERVLRAVQAILEEKIAQPILIGRQASWRAGSSASGSRCRPGRDFEIVNPEDDPRYRDYVATLCEVGGARASPRMRPDRWCAPTPPVIGALAVRRGDADALICGPRGRFASRLRYIRDIIGLSPGVREMAALSLIITAKGAYFIADTHVRLDPSADEIADMTVACAHHVERFGIKPKIAFSATAISAPPTPARPSRCARRWRWSGARARSRGRRRDAGRLGAVPDDPRPGEPVLDLQR
jgi:malate dehydrogenase (oxaloacetate-decarboxylating)(NADP+)